MALDLLSSPLHTEAPRPRKRPRLGWDDPDPAFLYAEAARFQLQVATQFLMDNPHLNISHQLLASNRSILPNSLSLQTDDVHKSFVEKEKLPPVTSTSTSNDDKDGHICFELGENLTPRYKILRKMGEGTFGRVLECWDRDENELVAVKVVRNVEKYREDAMIEIEILSKLSRNDRAGSRGCVRFKRWFDHQNHVCMVFEKLGPSLFDFLKTNDYRPFSVSLVREFGRQLLESVAYLHGLSLIHTDLKPENILLVSSEYTKVFEDKNNGKHSARTIRVPKSSKIKLIDFGSTTVDRECSYSVVSTRHYRAPEVILGSGWSYPCDIWSIGCILVELCSGEVLFQTRENLEHLAMMERILGPIPHHMIRRANRGRADKYFRHGRRLNWPEGAPSRDSIHAVRRLSRLKDIILEHVDHSATMLLDLIEQLLQLDPADRPTAKQALDHPFFRTH